jgi:hypothetical protein
VTAEEALQSQDVVLGMLPANSHPTMILFDFEASHSFISSKFVVKHNLPIAIIKYTMFVDSKGIDIILGMDWLRKYDEVILWAKRAI